MQLDRQHDQIMELEDKVQEPSLSLFSEFVISPNTEGANGPFIWVSHPSRSQCGGAEAGINNFDRKHVHFG